MSKAEIRFPKERLLDLPPGAVYRNHAGQATIEAAVRSDTVYLTATCDSLSRETLRLEEELRSRRNEKRETVVETKTNTPTGIAVRLRCFLYGLLTGFLFIIILKIKQNGKTNR